MSRKILGKLITEEANPEGELIDRAADGHKRRIGRALRKCTDGADFDRRVAKSRRKFDAQIEGVLESLALEAAGQNPLTVIGQEGFAKVDRARRAEDRDSGETRVPDQGQVMGSEGRSGQLSPQRQQAMERLEEQARMQKCGDETDEQSFARFITSDPVGREMFADYRNSQLMDVLKSFGCAPDGKSAEWQPPRAEADVPTSEAYRNLLKRAEQDQRAGETSEQAFARAYADPANRTLVDADRAEQHARVAKAMGGGVRG